MSNANTMIAGWYDDPAGADTQRWWDGAAWTTQQRPRQGLGSWTMPSDHSNVPIAPAAQPLAITTASAASSPEAPAQPEPFSKLAPQPEPYFAQPAPQPAPYFAQPAPQPEPFGQPAPQPDPFGQLAPQPDPFDQLLSPYPSAGSNYAPIGGPPTTAAPASVPGRSAQTVGIWLLAFWPFVGAFITGLTQGFAIPLLAQLGVPPVVGGLSGFFVATIVAWVLAGLDIRALRRRGYEPPSILWMLLLPPLAYFIARGRRVRRAGGKAWPPELAYFLSVGFIIVAVVVGTIFSLSLLRAAGIDPFDEYAKQQRIQDQPTKWDYGRGIVADQDYEAGTLLNGSTPAPDEVGTLIAEVYGFDESMSDGLVDCSGSESIIDYSSTFPCAVVDFNLDDAIDSNGNISVTIDADGRVRFSQVL